MATTLTIKIDHTNFDPFTIKVFKSSENKLQFKSSCDEGKEFEIPIKGSQNKLYEEISPYYTDGLQSMTFSTNTGSKSKDKVVQSWDKKSKRPQSHLEKAIKDAVAALKEGSVMSSKSKSKQAMMPLVNPKRRKSSASEVEDSDSEEAEAVVVASAPSSSKKKAHHHKKMKTVHEPEVVKVRKQKRKSIAAPPTIVPEETINNAKNGAGNVNQTVTEPITNGNVAPGTVLV